jgi:hypothetical protein
MKNTKRLKSAFLIVFLFSIFPIFSALAVDDLLLSNYDANNILGSLPRIMTDEWITSIVEAKSGKEQAAIVILKKAAQQNKLNYLLEQAPKEVMKEVARVGWQIYSIGSATELSEIIGGFEKETVKESVDYLLKVLKEQQIKISFGDFDVEYETIDSTIVKSGLQYIMIYKPITETSGRIVIRIYSADALTPPKSKGDPWSAAINYTWFSDSEIEASKHIPPFIAEINGPVERRKTGYWQKEIIHEYDIASSVGVNLNFPSIVPRFEFPEEEGWLGKILSSVKEKFQWIADLLGAGLVKEEDIFTEQASSSVDNTINFQEELNNKIAELEKKYNQASSDSQTTKSEIDKLREDMTNLFKQFAFINEPEEEPEATSSFVGTSTVEVASSSQEISTNLVISEICAGMDNAKSEFVEIFNPNDYPVTIGDDNFSLWIVDSKDKPTKKKITWVRNKIPPKGYFLFAGSDLFFSGLKFDADAYYSNQITSIGGVILSQKSGEDFDKAGWGKLTSLPPESGIEGNGKILENGLESGASLNRKMFGQGYIDTDDNEKDFDLSSFPSPRNSLGQESIYYPKSQYNFSTSGGSSFSVPTPTNTQTTPSPKLLISEIKNKGESSSNDFIELFNPTSADVDIEGWQLKKKTSFGTESSIIVFDDGSIIKSKQYFVWASTKDGYSQEIGANASSSSYLADNNSVALLDKGKVIIDAVAWQESTNPFVEGNSFDFTHDINQSIGRKITGTGPQYSDGNNNSTDFEIQIPTPKRDNQKYQAISANTQGDEVVQDDTAQCLASDVVISEVKLSKTEYVEIFNPKSQAVSLDDCFLGYFSANNDWNNPSRTWKFDNGLNIPSRQHFLIGIYTDPLNTINFDWQVKSASSSNYSIQQIAPIGAIGIFSCSPSTQTDVIKVKDCKIDAVGWDGALVKEEKTTQASAEEKSISRIIAPDNIGQVDYQDTDNNEEDFEIQEPTPKTFSHHNFTDIDNDGLLDIKDINVSIGFNTFLEPGEYTFKNLNIINNAKLSIKGNCANDLGVKIIVKNLTIESGASISADYSGCSQGQGAGSLGSGGGYGGRGAGDNSVVGANSFYQDGGKTYGDFFLPANLGSGGGNADGITGGKGGGAVIIEAEEKINIEGSLSANGESVAVARAGAGSGGSILLTANEISGSGLVTANGGNCLGGGGGGGRIAIYYNFLNLPSENIQVYGGDGSNIFDGAAGTIFLKNKTQDRGELIVKNNNLVSLTQTTIETDLILKVLELGAGSRILFKGNNIDSNDILISSKSVLQFENDVAIKTDSLVVLGEGNILNIPQKTIGIKGGIVTVKGGGKIEGNVLMLADALNVLEGSYLSADKMGNPQDQGFGAGALGSGGGYGGRGGGDEVDIDASVYGEKGLSYGDFRLPSEYGSGGGTYSFYGGYGGGLLKLEVKNISINGIISANGGVGTYTSSPYGERSGGAGSGGGIAIKTENLSGVGEITTNGGSNENPVPYSCGGGGGRIAVYYTSKDSFSGKFKSLGGGGSSGSPFFIGDPGTIYLQQTEASEGELKFGEV